MKDFMTSQKLIVVTGGAGFLGSVLVPMLVQRGYRVRVVDRFFFGVETLKSVAGKVELVRADTRWCPASVYDGAYAVIDLAALSNDPAGELDPERTREINFHARIRTAGLAKAAGAERYILASSCSVYGFQDGIVDESATPAPVTTYAESSLQAEGGVLALNDDTFSVTVLRQGTLYGLSPRMRFDLVVNAMTVSLMNDGIITVRGGEQWRPLLHVADSAEGFCTTLEAPREVVAGEIFNLGATEHNFTVLDVANYVSEMKAEASEIVHDKTALDTRSYRVSFEKIKNALGFVPRKHPRDGAREITAALDADSIDERTTRTIDWYLKLLADDPLILDRPFESADFL
jgi:nucleoside-diphosphate-sugar epimerase